MTRQNRGQGLSVGSHVSLVGTSFLNTKIRGRTNPLKKTPIDSMIGEGRLGTATDVAAASERLKRRRTAPIGLKNKSVLDFFETIPFNQELESESIPD